MSFPFLSNGKKTSEHRLIVKSRSPKCDTKESKSSFLRLSMSKFSEVKQKVENSEIQKSASQRSAINFRSPYHKKGETPVIFKTKRSHVGKNYLPSFFESASKETGDKSNSSTNPVKESATFRTMQKAATLSRLKTSMNQSSNEIFLESYSDHQNGKSKQIIDLDSHIRGNFNDLPVKRQAFITSCNVSYRNQRSLSFVAVPSMNTSLTRRSILPGNQNFRRSRNNSIYKIILNDGSNEDIQSERLSHEDTINIEAQETGAVAGFDGSLSSFKMLSDYRYQGLSSSHKRQLARKKALRELLSMSNLSRHYNKSNLNVPSSLRKTNSKVISEFTTEDLSSNKFAKINQPASSNEGSTPYLINSTERQSVTCPLIPLRLLPKPLCEHYEVSSVLQKLYSSYWLECIDKLLESQKIFEEEPGYNIILKIKMGMEEFRPLNLVWNEGPNLTAYLDFLSKIVIDLDHSHII